MNVRLYLLQRGTAMLMAPLVLIHLGVIFYATSRGLTAADILGRTQGSIGWAAYYSTFVIAAATHAAIGLRVIVGEWLAVGPRLQDALMWSYGLVLAALGLFAVAAVVLP